MLDNNSPIPLYYQLKSYIEDQISSTKWKPGEQIPSEAELSQQYKISRTTVRQAISELVNQGKLVRTQGRGTFVAQYNIEKPIFRLTGFSQDMRSKGLRPSSKVLKFEAIPPPTHIIRYLNLKENEPAIIIERLRRANEEIMAVEICYLSFNRFFGLLHEDLETNSMYDTLGEKYNTIPTRSIRSIQAIGCTAAESELLKIPIGAPILYLISTNFDQNDQPFEHAQSYYRGDRYTFNAEFFSQN